MIDFSTNSLKIQRIYLTISLVTQQNMNYKSKYSRLSLSLTKLNVKNKIIYLK